MEVDIVFFLFFFDICLISTLICRAILIWSFGRQYCPEASRSGGGYWSGGKLLAEWLSLVAETGVYYIVFVTKELS